MIINGPKGYVEAFESTEELKQIAQEYIRLLGLQDWLIAFKLTDDLDNDEWAGSCECIWEEKSALIKIRKTIPDDLWFKQPHEATLIHELMHCKMPIQDNGTMSGNTHYTLWHQILNDVAMAIFNVKYDLRLDDYHIHKEE